MITNKSILGPSNYLAVYIIKEGIYQRAKMIYNNLYADSEYTNLSLKSKPLHGNTHHKPDNNNNIVLMRAFSIKL